MKILLSIKPEFAEKILNGEKQFEFRKVIPKSSNVKTVVIYATLPVGKVVGEFDVEKVLCEKPDYLWEITEKMAGISQKFFNDYFCGRNKAYAIQVKKARRYKQPVALKTFVSNGVAPQSFCYL